MREPNCGLIIGGYRLEAVIARGGMGTIFRARHVELGTDVAVKILKPDLSTRADVVKRFLREGRLVSRLDHPGIVKVYDVGREEELFYLVMQFIDGRNLQQVVEEQGPMPWETAVDISRQIVDALDHAHGYGIVHRDIKPSNILLARSGEAYVTDFGIARLLEQETNLTKAGCLIGTPTHMSPEQCRGAKVDARSDLYSLGATLYTILAARPPFASPTTAQLIAQLLNDNPTPIEAIVPELPSSVASLVKRLMAKLPAARFQTAREVRFAISEIIDGPTEPSTHDRTVDAEPEEDFDPNVLLNGILVGACLLAIVCVLSYVWLDAGDSAPATAGATTRARRHEAPAASRPRHIATNRRPHAQPDEPVDSPTATAADHAERRRLLEERIRGFQQALSTGKAEEAYRYLHPGVNRDKTLLISLGQLIRSIDMLGESPELDFTMTMDDRKADVYFHFAGGADREFRFPATWRFTRGTWWVAPQKAGAMLDHERH